MYYDKMHSPEAQEWCYRMMNDPNEWEKFRYKDTIDDYNSVIEHSQKLYNETPVTAKAANPIMRARCLSNMKRAQRELAEIQAEYDIFKKYKMRTAIRK
jgi:hypothetical protein